MKNTVFLAAMFAAAAALVWAAPAPAAEDFSGTWLGIATLPDGAVDEFTLVLKKEKDAYTGTIVDSLKAVPPETTIQSVKVEGSVISFAFPWPDGAVIYCRLAVTGEKMTGDWTHSAGTKGALVFEKKKGYISSCCSNIPGNEGKIRSRGGAFLRKLHETHSSNIRDLGKSGGDLRPGPPQG